MTTTDIASKNGPTMPPTNNIGAKAAIVVSTPNVAGTATRRAPLITLSSECPSALTLV